MRLTLDQKQTRQSTRPTARLRVLVGGCLLAGLGSALGQIPTQRDVEIPVGAMAAYPILTVSGGYHNNLYDQEGNQQSSWALFLRGGAGVQGERRGHLYGMEYVADIGRYATASQDDFVDQRFTLYGGHAFSLRNNIDVGAEFVRGHDARGEEDPTLGSRHSVDADEPDIWNLFQTGGSYVYGAPGARGSLDLSTCWSCLQYTNNDQEFRDRNIFDLGGTFYARASPKTRGLLQVIYSDYDYTNQDETPDFLPDRGSLDSTEMRYLAGVEWDATAKTNGTFRFGWLDKNFDKSSDREDYSDPIWMAHVFWTPRFTDQFGLGYSRNVYEKLYYDEVHDDDFVQVALAKASWNRSWGPRLSSGVNLYRAWDDYTPSGRSDDRYGAGATVRYVLNRWATIGLGYWFQKRDSSLPEHDYIDRRFALDFSINGLMTWGARASRACRIRGSGVAPSIFY